jgi:hypothetical protein
MGWKMSKKLDVIEKFSKNWLGGALAPPSPLTEEIEKFSFLDM